MVEYLRMWIPPRIKHLQFHDDDDNINYNFCSKVKVSEGDLPSKTQNLTFSMFLNRWRFQPWYEQYVNKHLLLQFKSKLEGYFNNVVSARLWHLINLSFLNSINHSNKSHSGHCLKLGCTDDQLKFDPSFVICLGYINGSQWSVMLN